MPVFAFHKILMNALPALANHLIQDGLLKNELALHAENEAKKINQPFISYLVKNNIVSSETILKSCATHFGLPISNLDEYQTECLTNEFFPMELIHQLRILPLKMAKNTLWVGLSDPTDRHALDTITFYTGLHVLPTLVLEDALERFLQQHCIDASNKNLKLSLLNGLSIEENKSDKQEYSENTDEPIIRFVDHLIQHALQHSASDIHIEPYETICRIRYRQNGLLYSISEIPIHLATRLGTRLKVMAKLDIAERRLPQDGRFQLHQIDLRINTCPTLFGEKIVLRLLDVNKVAFDINLLGFTEHQKNIFLKKITAPQGLILVTGPTGSGKTMTLYSALRHLNIPEKNISTVEDPVEIQLHGINQVNINLKINLSFATALRTFLRQDPDIIMVGEVRDLETAEIAIQASQTGHLVLSTLHTNSALETITRLQSMGVANYNMISSISVIIAQRLVRKLCDFCKQKTLLSPTILQQMGINLDQVDLASLNICSAIGCQHCLYGYQGRIGIYEVLILSESIAKLIMTNVNKIDILAAAKGEGFITLREVGLEKVKQGITTWTEINRVLMQ